MSDTTDMRESKLALASIGACFAPEVEERAVNWMRQDVIFDEPNVRIFLQHWRYCLGHHQNRDLGEGPLEYLLRECERSTDGQGGPFSGQGRLSMALLRMQVVAGTTPLEPGQKATFYEDSDELSGIDMDFTESQEWRIAVECLRWFVRTMQDGWDGDEPSTIDATPWDALAVEKSVTECREQFSSLILSSDDTDFECLSVTLYAWICVGEMYTRRLQSLEERKRPRAVRKQQTESGETGDCLASNGKMISARAKHHSEEEVAIDKMPDSDGETLSGQNEWDDGFTVSDIAPLAAIAYFAFLRLVPSAFTEFIFRKACRAIQPVRNRERLTSSSLRTSRLALYSVNRLFETDLWVETIVSLCKSDTSDGRLDRPTIHVSEHLSDALSVASDVLVTFLCATFDSNFDAIYSNATIRSMAESALRLIICLGAILSPRLAQQMVRCTLSMILGSDEQRNLPSRMIHRSAVAILREAINDVENELGLEYAERVRASVLLLMQHICVRAPDRSDRRQILVSCVLNLFSLISEEMVYRFCDFLVRISCHPRSAVRLISVEIASGIEEEPDNDPSKTERDRATAWNLFQNILFSRCRDRHATVRAKSLSAIGTGLNQLGTKNRRAACWMILNARTLMESRLADDKSMVRRASLGTMFALLSTMDDAEREWDHANWILSSIQNRCIDEAVTVRSKALEVLTSLAQCGGLFACMYHDAWLDGALRLVHDPEKSVSDACLEGIETLFLKPLHEGMEDIDPLVQKMVGIAGRSRDPRKASLHVALDRLAQTKRISEGAANAFCRMAAEKGHSGAWQLMARLIHNCEPVQKAAVMAILERDVHYLHSVGGAHLSSAQVEVVAAAASRAGCASQVHEDSKTLLFGLNGRPELIPSLLGCVRETQPLDDASWCASLQRACEELLTCVSSQVSPTATERLCAMMAVGELGLYHHLLPSATLITALEAMLGCADTSDLLRSYVIVCLGKVSLGGDLEYASRFLPLFFKELETSPSAVIRNNVVLVLSDLCRSFTSLVDQHAARIAACIKDESALVRYQTIAALAGLLQEEYIKPKKDGLVFLFLAATQDPAGEIRALACHSLERVFFPKFPEMRVNHLIEAIFYFNDVTSNPRYNQTAGMYQSEHERLLFTLPGGMHAATRHRIYILILDHCTNEQKLMIADRLCIDVLGTYLDHELRQDGTAEEAIIQVVSDTLQLLRSRALTVHTRCTPSRQPQPMWMSQEARSDSEEIVALKKNQVTEEATNPTEGCDTALQTLHKQLIARLARKSLVDVVLPCLVEIRQLFEQQKSPLLGVTIDAIRERVREYRNELGTLFHNDRAFAKEIAQDFEREDRERRQRQTAGTSRNRANKADTGSLATPSWTDARRRSTAMPDALDPVTPAPLADSSDARYLPSRSISPCGKRLERRQSLVVVTPAAASRLSSFAPNTARHQTVSVPRLRPRKPSPIQQGKENRCGHQPPPSTPFDKTPLSLQQLEQEDAFSVSFDHPPSSLLHYRHVRHT